jgi:hypothetical protein
VSLCKLANLPDFENPEWIGAAHELGIASKDVNPDPVKKYWEYIHLVYGLKKLQCLNPATEILSVGCGYEIPMLYLTNHVDHIVGIDLFKDVDDIQAPLNNIDQKFSFPIVITTSKAGGLNM